MALVKDTDCFYITEMHIKSETRACVVLVNGSGTRFEYDLIFKGSSNRVLDSYAYLQTLPEWVGFSIDFSDVDLSIQGHGGVVLFQKPPDLHTEKLIAKERITNARNWAERSGFVAYGKLFDSDDKAIQRLLGASQAAAIAKQLGQPLSIEWTCADNTTLIMDADMLIEIPVILAQTADALHQKARTLKAQIDAATTLNEIAAIVW